MFIISKSSVYVPHSLFFCLCEFGFCILGISWIMVSTIFFYPNALFFSLSFSQGHGPFNRTKSVLRILRVWPGRRRPWLRFLLYSDICLS